MDEKVGRRGGSGDDEAARSQPNDTTTTPLGGGPTDMKPLLHWGRRWGPAGSEANATSCSSTSALTSHRDIEHKEGAMDPRTMEEGVTHATPDLAPTPPDPGRQSANREGGAPPAGPCEGGGRAAAVWGGGCVKRVAPPDPAPASPDLSLTQCREQGLGERAAGTGE
jgi:hypothetical protein